MFPLACTVRNCTQNLQPTPSGLLCQAGHCFDRAKQGYYNLLQPQDSRSKKPGDCDAAVEARHRWLQLGHMDGLIEMLAGWCDRLPTDITDKPKSLDLGCGEGTFGAALFKSAPEDFCGIDLSRRAILLARKKMPTATWILSNADRRIPAASGSVHRILSLFGRRPIGEMHRILAQRGLCIVAVPGTNDLIELREEVQQSGHQRDRTKAIIAEFSEAGFEIQDHASWTHQATLDKSAIADALAMTYRGVRNSQQQRVDGLNSLIVTLQADLLLFQHA